MKIAVFLPNWIGDVVMATPTLRALRSHFEAAHITGIMRPYVAEVLRGSSLLDETLLYNRRSEDRELGAWRVVQKMRAFRFDKVVLCPNSLSSALIAWLSGAAERVGYARYGRGPLLTTKLYPPRSQGNWEPISAVDYYLDLATAMGCPASPKTVELDTTALDDEIAARLLIKRGILGHRPLVLLNNSGAFGGAKLWPNEYFAILARQAADELNADVLVLCGPSERETAREITLDANHERVQSLADDVPAIGLLKAIIRRAQAMVSTDSGPRHIAAAFGVPTVALFGPIDPRWSVNYSPVEVPLYKSLSCSPCARHTCPLGHHRCMRDITPNEAFFALRRLFCARPRAAAA